MGIKNSFRYRGGRTRKMMDAENQKSRRNIEILKKGINMKKEKTESNKKKHIADDWVAIAKKFGEDCLEIQEDSQLSIDQKLEKQESLGNKIAKDIQDDSCLMDSDKQQMVYSIHSYIQDWKKLYDNIQKLNKPKKDKSH